MQVPSIHFRDYFTSVGDVWLLWAVGLLASAVLVRRAFRLRPWKSVAAFAADEHGASYALSYVLTFPFYLLLMCLIMQATLILMVKIGTVYAAHAAARAAIVWGPSQPERPSKEDDGYRRASKKAHRAAALAMAPFATGYQHHLDKMYYGIGKIAKYNPFAQIDAELYYLMYQRIATHNTSVDAENYLYFLRRFDPDALAQKKYVENKLLFASLATFVEFPGREVPTWNEDYELSVTYFMPMHVPAVGRFFGSRMGGLFVRDITTTATLPSEAPETESNRMNIPYDPDVLVGLKVLWPE
jgi:hypothetical protein